MNFIRGSLNQNRNMRRKSVFGRRRFDCPPVFHRIRPRITSGTSSLNSHSLLIDEHLQENTVNATVSYNLTSNTEIQSIDRVVNENYNASTIETHFDDSTDRRINSVGTNLSVSHENRHDFRLSKRNEFITSDDSYQINENVDSDVWEISDDEDLIDRNSFDINNNNNLTKKSRRQRNFLLQIGISKSKNKDTDKIFTFSRGTDAQTNEKVPEIPVNRSIFASESTGNYLTSIFGRNQSSSSSCGEIQGKSESVIGNSDNTSSRIKTISNENLSSSRMSLENGGNSNILNNSNDISSSRLTCINDNEIFFPPNSLRKDTGLSLIKPAKNLNKYTSAGRKSGNNKKQNQMVGILRGFTNGPERCSTSKRGNHTITNNNSEKGNSTNVGQENNSEAMSRQSAENYENPSDLVTKILQTPDANQHLILPLLTSSCEKGFKTPVRAAKQIQALQPLNSFSGSGRRNSSGPQPHTTPSDRLRTPKSTSGTHDSVHHTVLAVTEGRGLARGEVGIAVIDVKRPQLVLCQISDAQTYTNTLTKINYFNPVEILVPNTFVESPQTVPLFDLLNDYFPNASLTTVQRRHFNDKIGLSQVQSLCLPEYSSVELIIKHKFYALSAAAALIKYIEFSQTVLFSKRSIKVEYEGAEDMMTIDMESAKQLELVLCNSGGGYEKSLLGILNHCSTVSGCRYLRANILQPPFNRDVTIVRLNCVTELVEDPNLLASLKRELVKFEDVEQLLWLCMQLPNLNVIDKPNEMQMNFILLLKTTLTSLPGLIDCLNDAHSQYFQDVLTVLKDSRYDSILEIILKSINEDARIVKGFMASQHQRCFAIKPQVNGLLDVARSTYSGLVEQTHNKVIELSREYNLPLKLGSTNSKGMHIQLSLAQNRYFNVKDMPPVFIQVNRVSKNLITCTTEDILILNQRMKHALREIQLMSNVIVGEILHKIREHIGCLYKLCEIVAELDVLLSFALVSSSPDFVRPVFGTDLHLEAARHPILDVINSSRPVGNDVKASKESNFHIITGPNMGGKSIYIRQVALLQIMAQIGCYIPAKSAQFCFIRSLFTRIGFDDNIEMNASTFKLEMLQMKYILQSAVGDSTSLIIIDELCRGTCCEEGTAIAWALCRELAALNAFTFFTTHFHFLTQLERIHPNVKNWHFEAEEKEDGRLKYTHRLLPGVTTVSNYGIQLAKSSSLPDSVLKLIIESKEQLSTLNKEVSRNFMNTQIETENHDALKILANKFVDLLNSEKSVEELFSEIKQFIGSELSMELNNSEDIVNDDCEEFLQNDSSNQNTEDRLCNVEVQLEEIDGIVNYSSEHNNEENLSTQDCVDMLQDHKNQNVYEHESVRNDSPIEHEPNMDDNIKHELVEYYESMDDSIEIIDDNDENESVSSSHCDNQLQDRFSSNQSLHQIAYQNDYSGENSNHSQRLEETFNTAEEMNSSEACSDHSMGE